MKNIITLIICLGLGLVPVNSFAEPGCHKGPRHRGKEKIKAHFRQQKTENEAFRESIRELSVQEKAKAMSRHRQAQYAENVAFFETVHQKAKVALTERLADNDNLNEEEKQNILNSVEARYQGRKRFQEQQHQENLSVLNQIAYTPNMTEEEARSLLQDHRKSQKQQRQQFRKDRRVGRKDIRENLRRQEDWI